VFGFRTEFTKPQSQFFCQSFRFFAKFPNLVIPEIILILCNYSTFHPFIKSEYTIIKPNNHKVALCLLRICLAALATNKAFLQNFKLYQHFGENK
jgi:hypothetical protein